VGDLVPALPARNAGTGGRPAALFRRLFVLVNQGVFDAAGGRLVDTHMGELTRASLASTLRRRFGVSAAPVEPDSD
jgi:hypothetical protein